MLPSSHGAHLHACAKALFALVVAWPLARPARADGPEADLPDGIDVAGVSDRTLKAGLGGEASAPADEPEGGRPSPLEVDYAQYGVAIVGEVPVVSGGICPTGAVTPCIIGLGGGPLLRGGWRPSGPWYLGAAYQFAKLDSNNLYRLGILQTLKAEMRYFIDVGSRFTPYVTWSAGSVVYGNEFGVETGGAVTSVGAGVEFEITRMAVVGANLSYEPMLLAAFTDTAGQERETGVAHFVHMELTVELRSELGRE